MMEVEQNLKKILAKIHRQKRPKNVYIQKNKTYQYLVKATEIPNSNIN